LKYIDIKGLIIYLCTRTVTIGPGIGNHAYIWDSRTHQWCGRNKGFDPLKSCSEKGPGPNGDSCVVVPGSGGKEGKIMNCCHKSGNDGPWVPPFSDCHTSAKKCIEMAGLKYPGAPGGRGGPCDSCWTKPYDDPSTGP
jgi:hypothetical protein